MYQNSTNHSFLPTLFGVAEVLFEVVRPDLLLGKEKALAFFGPFHHLLKDQRLTHSGPYPFKTDLYPFLETKVNKFRDIWWTFKREKKKSLLKYYVVSSNVNFNVTLQ